MSEIHSQLSCSAFYGMSNWHCALLASYFLVGHTAWNIAVQHFWLAGIARQQGPATAAAAVHLLVAVGCLHCTFLSASTLRACNIEMICMPDLSGFAGCIAADIMVPDWAVYNRLLTSSHLIQRIHVVFVTYKIQCTLEDGFCG